MKKLFTILALVLSLSIVAFSQDFAKKGTWELGGTIGFSSSTAVFDGASDPNGAQTTFTFSPEAGYLITDNFELSILPLSYTSQSYNGHSSSQFNFLLAPAWNFEMNSNVYPYIQGMIGYGTITTGGNTYSGADYGVQGGIKLQIAKSSLINIGLSYLLTNRELSSENTRFGENILQINAGFSVFLR